MFEEFRGLAQDLHLQKNGLNLSAIDILLVIFVLFTTNSEFIFLF